MATIKQLIDSQNNNEGVFPVTDERAIISRNSTLDKVLDTFVTDSEVDAKILASENNISENYLSTLGGTVNGDVTVNGYVKNNMERAPFTNSAAFLCPTAINGDNVNITFGKYQNTNNLGYIGHLHVADGSELNGVTIGGFAADYLVNILYNGNVGIGTTSPSEKLEVNGNVKASSFIGSLTGTATNADTLDNLHASNFVRSSSYPNTSDNNWSIPDGIYQTTESSTGLPVNSAGHHVIHCDWDQNAANQLFLAYDRDVFSFRRKINNVWQPWKTVAFTDSNVASATKATQDGSGNVITSTYVTNSSLNSGITTSKPLVTFDATSIAMDPNKYYRLTASKTTLTITLNAESNANILNEYFIEFPCGGSVTLPSSIKWANGEVPEFETGVTYQISIVNGLGLCSKFS